MYQIVDILPSALFTIANDFVNGYNMVIHHFIMLYFSQILNSRVEDSADHYIGRLKDVLIRAEPGVYSPLMFLLVRRGRKEMFIPYSYVENLSKRDISVKTLFAKLELTVPKLSDFTFLNRDVMDQQIVDVVGARVVRVNDLSLGSLENKMHVLGIDVSGKGLLRRLGLSWLDFGNWMKVNLIDWRGAQRVRGILKLDKVAKNLNKLHPADLANIIEDLSVRHGSALVRSLDSREAAKVIEEMDPHLQKILINHLGPEKAAKIIEKMSIDEIVDLMQLFPNYEAQQYLAYLHHGNLSRIENLIAYEGDTAGGLMTTDYMTAPPDWTVEKLIEEVKIISPVLRSLLFVYITDEDEKFMGPVSVRNLLVADKNQTLDKLLKPVSQLATLKPEDSLDEVVNTMTKYNLYSAAVVNAEGKLAGVVSIDDVMRCLAPKA